jgi:hypothetical protein
MTTEKTIYDTAISDGMPDILARMMVAQSKVESGNYKHDFFTKGKNAFGYSYDPNSHWQLDKGGRNADNGVAIAQYENVINSTHEITHWIKRRQNDGQFPKDLNVIKTPAQYARYLIDGAHKYYKPSREHEYILGIVFWMGSKMPAETVAGIGGIFLLIIFLILFNEKRI